jgi:hypothetical protein
MSKKSIMGLAPLLAVAAFAIAPAAASAVTTYGTCEVTGIPHSGNCPNPATERFFPFAAEKRVAIFGKKVSATFVLENEAETAGIECSEVAAAGVLWNVGAIGHSHTILAFEGCKGIKGLAVTCGAGSLPNGNGIIEGVVTDEVKAQTEVDVVIQSGFPVVCGATNLGEVTGSVIGKQTEKTSILKFAKAKGLKFAGENAQITGELEFLTSLAPNKKVYI